MIGEIAGIGAATTWAMANYIFSHNLVSCNPMLFNFLTGVTAIAIFLLVLPFQEVIFPPTPFKYWMMLQLSGVVGIGLGDSLFFSAVKNIGPRKTLLMETLASPFTGLISFIYFGDSIGFVAWLGMFTVVCGIILVVNEQHSSKSENSIELLDFENQTELESVKDIPTESKQQLKGYLYAIGAMFCQALGMVLARDALAFGSFNPITSSFIRQVAGQLSVLILLIIYNEKIYIPQQTRRQNSFLFIGILLGQVICLWFQQLSLQYTRAEIAQTLMSTSPLFALALSKYQGETISQRAIFGSFAAFIGVCLIINGN